MASKRSFTFNPYLGHYAAFAGLALALIIGLLRCFVIGAYKTMIYAFSRLIETPSPKDRVDPLHCHALSTKGRWLDERFSSWQPNGELYASSI